ncbi:hypothetical protein FRB95_009140 [Tulasnella sp. JGI-2019a]|nr:hypothetical protein FRB93_012373 [Tulasnella sp. JGI-2019a]KAG9039560.1 hypothetical protein FRB95_009140 [Tulasnella sp. JGI-2019a]
MPAIGTDRPNAVLDAPNNNLDIPIPNANPTAEATLPRARESSLIRELAIVSLIVAPLALLPLLATRHGLRRISQHVHEIKTLQADAIHQSSLMSSRAAMQDRTRLESMRMEFMKHREVSGMRLGTMGKEVRELQKILAEVKSRADADAQAVEDGLSAKSEVAAVRNDMKALALAVHTVAKGQAGVHLSAQTLEGMASSLVDIAAFIEEVETLEGLERRGSDPRGVEKIRKLALKLHSVAGSPPQPQMRDSSQQT